MGQPVFLREHWEKLTPFNVLAVYVQPAVDAARHSRFPAIHSDYLWSLRQDNVLLQQSFANAAKADEAARILTAQLPSLMTVSSEPFVAVRRNAVSSAFSDQTRTVVVFANNHSFYVQYAHEYLAQALAKRIKDTLQLGK